MIQPDGGSVLLADKGRIKPIFFMLVDISGYTKFIRYHKVSLLHAEKIVSLLMESILEKVEFPVIAHEILGDAISLYALDEGMPGQADLIYAQLMQYFEAFRQREAHLISECSICECQACKDVGKLKLKAILHAGEAAFTTIFSSKKISGEDVIIGHRLLKNSVPANEYIIMTSSFANRFENLHRSTLLPFTETCEGIGDVDILVHAFEDIEIKPSKLSLNQRLRGLWAVEKYMIQRLFAPARIEFKNLPR